MPLRARRVPSEDNAPHVERPTYRVCFVDGSGTTQEWRIADVGSVHEVIWWADENAAGRTYVLSVEVEAAGTRLVRLDDTDPDVRSPAAG